MDVVAEPLATASDLTGFPGAPFADNVVAAACGGIRRAAGWHIAPVVTQIFTLDVAGYGAVLVLPTLKLETVTSVRDMTGDEPVDITGWRKSKAGLLYREGGWPIGFEAVEVTVTHGYTTCPDELLPVIADWTARRVMQESLGSRSVAYSADGDLPLSTTLAAFKIPSRP